MSDGNQSFKERNSKPNRAEELFREYCERQGVIAYHFGFDEKNQQIPKFYHLNPILRHLPDFIVHNPKTGRTMAVEVKGSLNYKQSDYERLDSYARAYGTDEAPYLIVFMLSNRIIWKKPEEVKAAYEWSTLIGSWDEGRTKYRTLDLG